MSNGVYRFGQFELNEDSRSLCLEGRELAVQPLVFDFLVLLLHHPDKAMSKAELLDALWPGVTVTEASLQRVASLARTILREGHMEAALRSLPRSGYRLILEAQPVAARSAPASPAPVSPAASPTTSASHVLTARAAIAARNGRRPPPPSPPRMPPIRCCRPTSRIGRWPSSVADAHPTVFPC